MLLFGFTRNAQSYTLQRLPFCHKSHGETKLKKTLAVCVSASLALSGCATSSKDVAATYASPLQYQSYDCAQLNEEGQRIRSRVVQLGGRLDEAAANDKAIMGVGILIFWPALFALGGTKQQEAEYSRLRGEADAVERMVVTKKCSRTETTVTAAAPAGGAETAAPVAVASPAAAASGAAK